MKKVAWWWPVIFWLFAFFIFPACSRLDKLEKNLNPEQAKWLSEVRYIITPEERKIS